MEYVILGLLMLRSRTLYEIKKLLESKIALFYSASFGSISSAINNLLAKDWISVHEHVENGRNKKMYTLTEHGRTAFEQWLRSGIPHEKVKEPALTRLFFMGYLPIAERITLLEQHLASLHTIHATLTVLEQEADNAQIPAELYDVVQFQQLTLQYGKEYYAFSIAWFQRLLAELKSKK
ncbi:MAG: PadR family transcriptional regulator [Herpetosiphon sp.]|nr:PadR family transcriptional regulator [Herpetosiphon sp.]